MKRSLTESYQSGPAGPKAGEAKNLTYVELYSGVGGWTMALEEAIRAVKPSVVLHCAAALDHSDLCTEVYGHNHSHHREGGEPSDKTKGNRKRTSAIRIQDLTLDQMIAWKADLIMMSPPCQPHSRQHSNQEKDLQDPRSQSFLHICKLLQKMPDENLPQLLFLENVVGFESSNSCSEWRSVLARRGYSVGHFHIEPKQVGIPNDRPRYFCVAMNKKSTDDLVGSSDPSRAALESYLRKEKPSEGDSSLEGGNEPEIRSSLKELCVTSIADKVAMAKLPSLQDFLGPDLVNRRNADDHLKVPQKVLKSSAAWCMDIVTPNDQRSACFTSSYGKFIRGTGSVFYMNSSSDDVTSKFALVAPEDREFDAKWAEGLDLANKLRYFSGDEMARLFGFPTDFTFPPNISQKQQWKLVGNSLNVRVAARLIELGLRTLWKIPVPSI